jgi:hypothetical protein
VVQTRQALVGAKILTAGGPIILKCLGGTKVSKGALAWRLLCVPVSVQSPDGSDSNNPRQNIFRLYKPYYAMLDNTGVEVRENASWFLFAEFNILKMNFSHYYNNQASPYIKNLNCMENCKHSSQFFKLILYFYQKQKKLRKKRTRTYLQYSQFKKILSYYLIKFIAKQQENTNFNIFKTRN